MHRYRSSADSTPRGRGGMGAKIAILRRLNARRRGVQDTTPEPATLQRRRCATSGCGTAIRTNKRFFCQPDFCSTKWRTVAPHIWGNNKRQGSLPHITCSSGRGCVKFWEIDSRGCRNFVSDTLRRGQPRFKWRLKPKSLRRQRSSRPALKECKWAALLAQQREGLPEQRFGQGGVKSPALGATAS